MYYTYKYVKYRRKYGNRCRRRSVFFYDYSMSGYESGTLNGLIRVAACVVSVLTSKSHHIFLPISTQQIYDYAFP